MIGPYIWYSVRTGVEPDDHLQHDHPGSPTLAARARPASSGRPAQPRRWLTVLRYATLCLLAAFFLLPVYVLVVTALRHPTEVSVVGMWQLPHSLSLDSFAAAWPKLARGLRNSVVLAVPASLISSLLGCRERVRAGEVAVPRRTVVFPLILFGIFVPYQADHHPAGPDDEHRRPAAAARTPPAACAA